jgi:hypothetical protein
MGVPSSVKAALGKLDPAQQKAYKRDYGRRRKSTLVAYIAWLLFGWHYLYMGRVGMQFAFWVTGGFLVVGYLIDFFRVPGMVARQNEDLARGLMAQHKMMAS